MSAEDQTNNEPDFLSMSDEEIMNMSSPPTRVEKEEVVEEETKEEEASDEEAGTASEETADDSEDATKKQEEDAPESVKESPTDAEDDKAADTDSGIDYKAEYERLTAPFKANGKDLSVQGVDDARALMQMGANYNKKMAALKPNLKLMKMLENNGLMSEENISFLVALGKKDPAAINKLVKDSGIDPMDLDPEKAKTYTQTTYAADDREIELDTVLDELQGTPTYTRTLDVVSNKWDVASKQVISQNPQLLRAINDHVASGIYDQISTEVERERMFGRLNGMSDIDAYRQVGDAIQARNGFAPTNTVQKPKPATPVVFTPAPRKVEDDKLKDKRRAASSTKAVAPSTPANDFNPLEMSDAEFNKLINSKYL